MKNFEKYEEEVKEITSTGKMIALKEGKPVPCSLIKCVECDFSSKHGETCAVNAVNWLYEEYKEHPQKPVELSDLGYRILRNLMANGYRYLARDEIEESLYAYDVEPAEKNKDGCWIVYGGNRRHCYSIKGFEEEFGFIQWSDKKPTNIKAVLNDCTIKEEE